MTPLRLPRSLIHQSSFKFISTAWRREACTLLMGMSLSERRPMKQGPWSVYTPPLHFNKAGCSFIPAFTGMQDFAQEHAMCNAGEKKLRIGRSANSAFFGSVRFVCQFTHALMKTDVLEPIRTRSSRACSASGSAAKRIPSASSVTSTQRPFCMLCVHCPKCLENPHTVSCDLCAGCRACSMHGRGC